MANGLETLMRVLAGAFGPQGAGGRLVKEQQLGEQRAQQFGEKIVPKVLSDIIGKKETPTALMKNFAAIIGVEPDDLAKHFKKHPGSRRDFKLLVESTAKSKEPLVGGVIPLSIFQDENKLKEFMGKLEVFGGAKKLPEGFISK